ncbi:hypothetical protein [Ornithinimicrobium sp. INDO-MA30-4]|uniref:hypothetical protein n=1 Tax=Ornithinimicrobium sp. INDO-MA30-4 TaxID=2908651 RepID=UPI001F3AF077|nr:hypothetical protein [Ornithinimicrobium sp. INDO-MA30-4]UJH69531.1 hypothetical protein L0A91_09105 [Ornithinimicrobium sp. INDO-MA30-4]
MSRLGSAKKFTYQRLHALSLTKRLVAVVVLMVLVAYLITTSLTTFLLRDYLTDRVDVELEQYLAPLGNAAYNQSAFGGGSSLTYNLPNTYVGLYTPVGGGSQIAIEQNSQLDRPDLTGILPDDERIGQSPSRWSPTAATGGASLAPRCKPAPLMPAAQSARSLSLYP